MEEKTEKKVEKKVKTIKRKQPTSSISEDRDIRPMIKRDSMELVDSKSNIDIKILENTSPTVSPMITPLVETKKIETSNRKLSIFISREHPWAMPYPPCTLVVAEDKDSAASMIINELISLRNKDYDMMIEKIHTVITPMPPIQHGVLIFSIGLGGVDIPERDMYTTRPIIEYMKSEKSCNNTRLYYCNSHFTSQATPAATLIVASDGDEAMNFMLQKLKSMKLPFSRETEVKEIDITKKGVYFLISPV
jgi:hypothetical protein